eukprot:3717427-Amphidinium_carterae.3
MLVVPGPGCTQGWRRHWPVVHPAERHLGQRGRRLPAQVPGHTKVVPRTETFNVTISILLMCH